MPTNSKDVPSALLRTSYDSVPFQQDVPSALLPTSYGSVPFLHDGTPLDFWFNWYRRRVGNTTGTSAPAYAAQQWLHEGSMQQPGRKIAFVLQVLGGNGSFLMEEAPWVTEFRRLVQRYRGEHGAAQHIAQLISDWALRVEVNSPHATSNTPAKRAGFRPSGEVTTASDETPPPAAAAPAGMSKTVVGLLSLVAGVAIGAGAMHLTMRPKPEAYPHGSPY